VPAATLSISSVTRPLDEIDPNKHVPVLASHTGYRFGTQEYLLTPATLHRIAERNGVVGLILAGHQLNDGAPTGHRRLGWPPVVGRRKRFARGFELLTAHIDAIHAELGSHRHTAIGSDLDGFIKPTLPGLADMRRMADLDAALVAHYGEADGALIGSRNALRVLAWRDDID
jgi:microsomal dipeptidase-like Zn-dependent dipeptidase